VTKDPKSSSGDTARAREIAEVRGRTLLILSVIEREEPGPQWASLRQVVENAARVTALRTIYREVRGFLAAMSPVAREQLERDLAQRFGPDAGRERERQVLERVRSAGRIRSESEYRIVQAHLDSLPPNASERHPLGALLDEFMAAR
jgi:hypothetical protein